MILRLPTAYSAFVYGHVLHHIRGADQAFEVLEESVAAARMDFTPLASTIQNCF